MRLSAITRHIRLYIVNHPYTKELKRRSRVYYGYLEDRLTRVFIYIGGEFIFSFFVAFLFFFFIFFVNQILLLAEKILAQRVPLPDVILLLVFSLPSIIALSSPFATLVGGLMAIGRLSSDNEILALRSCGVSLKRIFLPVAVIGLGITLLSFSVNDYFMPLGHLQYKRLFREILTRSPELALESYSIKIYKDTTIITGKVDDNYIEDIVIVDKDEEKNERVIVAEQATFLENKKQTGVLSLELKNVISQKNPKENEGEYSYLLSEKMIYNILMKDLSGGHVPPLGPKDLRVFDLWMDIRGKKQRFNSRILDHKQAVLEKKAEVQSMYSFYSGEKALKSHYDKNIARINSQYKVYKQLKGKNFLDKMLQTYRLEFHQKFALPFACFAFCFLAFPLGLYSKRSGRSVGFGLGLILSFAYWILLVGGRTLGIRLDFNPVLSMWIPDLLILMIGVYLIYRKLKK